MKVGKYFFTMRSNMETVFLFQLCTSDSQEDFTFHSPSLNMSHCSAVHYLKIRTPYEDGATS